MSLFPLESHGAGVASLIEASVAGKYNFGQAVERIGASNSFLTELRPMLTASLWGGLNVSHINVSSSFRLEHLPFQNSPPLGLQETCLFS